MSDLLVAYAADRESGYQGALSRGLKSKGIPQLYERMRPFSWRRKVLWELSVAEQYPDTLIAFIDAWDTVFVGEKDELEKLLSGGYVILPSDRVCWPHEEKASLFDKRLSYKHSPWRYVNGSGPAGLGRDIANVIKSGWEKYPITYDGIDHSQDIDQRFWTDVFLDDLRCELDVHCAFTTTLHKEKMLPIDNRDYSIVDGRFLNHTTGKKSLFVHGNARLPLPKGLWPLLPTDGFQKGEHYWAMGG
jgi:hypothetical protein